MNLRLVQEAYFLFYRHKIFRQSGISFYSYVGYGIVCLSHVCLCRFVLSQSRLFCLILHTFIFQFQRLFPVMVSNILGNGSLAEKMVAILTKITRTWPSFIAIGMC